MRGSTRILQTRKSVTLHYEGWLRIPQVLRMNRIFVRQGRKEDGFCRCLVQMLAIVEASNLPEVCVEAVVVSPTPTIAINPEFK